MSGYGFPAVGVQPPRPADAQVAPFSLPKNVVRIIEQGLWSTWQYADAQAVANRADDLFVTPIGQVGQGFSTALSYPETNSSESSRLPSGQAFDCYGLALQPYYPNDFEITRADLANLQNHLVVQWKFLQVRIDVAPAQLVGSGGGKYGATADTGALEGGAGGSRFFINNGPGTVFGYRETPVVLAANTTFNIDLVWGAYASAIDGGIGDSAMNVRVVQIGRLQTALAVG